MELAPSDRLVGPLHVECLVGFLAAVVEQKMVVVVVLYMKVGVERVGFREKELRQMDTTEIAHRRTVAHLYWKVEAMRLLVMRL